MLFKGSDGFFYDWHHSMHTQTEDVAVENMEVTSETQATTSIAAAAPATSATPAFTSVGEGARAADAPVSQLSELLDEVLHVNDQLNTHIAAFRDHLKQDKHFSNPAVSAYDTAINTYYCVYIYYTYFCM